MILQQSTSFTPLMRQSVAFAHIALWAGDYKIIRIAHAVSRNWDDVIKVIRLANFIAAIIASAFLSLVLGFYRLICDFTSGSALVGVSASLFRIKAIEALVPPSLRFLRLFGMGNSPRLGLLLVSAFVVRIVVMLTLFGAFGMFALPVRRNLTLFVSIAFVIALVIFSVVFLVSRFIATAFAILTFAGFAPTRQSISYLLVFVEKLIRSWERLPALGATLCRGIHSAPLYAVSLLLSAGGESYRRFNWEATPNLADYLIIPHGGRYV